MVKIDLIATGDTPCDVIAALRLLALGEAATATPAGADRMVKATVIDPEPITAGRPARSGGSLRRTLGRRPRDCPLEVPHR